ncbi:asparaginase domain-containing protein [Methylomonas sp. HYX-M1]|uniref:asparaginase domain-containing protein n=1 Tax=Methylomonas sp. HYX-M1 TaxID=3139307 RepID=UPI00345C2DE3
MKHVLLVFTGGTIGSQLKGDTVDTDPNAGHLLLDLFAQAYPQAEQFRFTLLKPLQMLSENLHPDAWRHIVAALAQQDLGTYDGIIVTHGTDTLAYSAALLGIYFHRLNIPLLLVSSDLPLQHPSANGLPNFICAADYIRQGRAAGVFVPYRNPGRTMQIHIGTRLSNCLPLGSDFISVQDKAFLSYQDGEFQACHELPEKGRFAGTLQNQFGKILLIRPYPGLDYLSFDLNGFDAVLHELYHSGTACASDAWGLRHSLIAFSRRCAEQGLPLYLAPALQSDSAYSSTRAILQHGARMLWNTGLEAAYAKLVLAYGNFSAAPDIAEFLQCNLAWEHVKPTV